MNAKPCFNDSAKSLVISNREQVLQLLPHNCVTDTRSGATYIHDTGTALTLSPCLCKQLTCRTCAAIAMRQLYDALTANAFTHYLVLTLPGDVQHHDIERKLKKALPRFFQEANRIPGTKRLSYFWALATELNPSSRLHVNILLNTDFSQATRYGKPIPNWAKKTWYRLTRAHRVSLEPIQPGTLGNVINYSLCDLLKTVIKHPRLRRRLGSSRNVRLNRRRRHGKDKGQGFLGRIRLTTTQCASALGISHSMPGNGTLTLPAATGLDALSKLLNKPDAAPAAPSPTPEVPSLAEGTPAGGTSGPADGTEALGTQQQQLLGGTMAFEQEQRLTDTIKAKLKAAGEVVWQRYPLPHTHPSFRSCAVAATRLLQEIAGAKTILVMRDVCLRRVRELILKSGLKLVIPNRSGTGVGLIPQQAMAGGILRIDPPPPGTTPYVGDVDVVVVACLAFNRAEKRLYTYEAEHTASVLDELRQGLDSGFTLNSNVPVVAVCADEQEVWDWPLSAQGFVEAGAVVTPTRTLVLGS